MHFVLLSHNHSHGPFVVVDVDIVVGTCLVSNVFEFVVNGVTDIVSVVGPTVSADVAVVCCAPTIPSNGKFEYSTKYEVNELTTIF
jgi:hypothetical protein